MDVLSDDEFDHVHDFDMTDSDSDGEYADHHGTPSTTPPRMHTPGRAGRKIISCPYDDCPKVFNRNSRLQEHVRSHTGERPFKCPHDSCPKAFLRDSHLKHHVTSAHSNIRNYKCAWEGCDKKFATGTRLRRHWQVHEGREKHRCRGYEGCSETFRKHETLKRHIRTVHEKKKAFPCDRILSSGEPCDQAYDTADGLKNHQRAMHDTSKFSCTICAAASSPRPNDAGVNASDSSPASLHAFETWHDLQEHIQQAHLATCELCSQSFNTNKQLTKHLETVHAIVDPTKQYAKQFPCPFDGCNHVFTKRGNLTVHVRTVHEKKKDFVCGTTDVPVPDELESGHGVSVAGCGRSFTSKASLVEHIRVAHFNLPTKRQQREANKRAKRQAESDLSSPPVVKRRKPRKDKGLKKSSTVASLSGLRNDATHDPGLTSFPPFSYASPTQPNGRRIPDNLMDEDTDEWNQLSGSMTLFGDHLYHNGQGYHLVSEDGSADQTRFDDGQYLPCDEPEPGIDTGEDMDTEPFFNFEHEREHVYNHIDPMLQQA